MAGQIGSAEPELLHPATDQIVVATRVEGDRVVVEVTDSGTGIPDDVIGRVFEPESSPRPANDAVQGATPRAA